MLLSVLKRVEWLVGWLSRPEAVSGEDVELFKDRGFGDIQVLSMARDGQVCVHNGQGPAWLWMRQVDC